MVQVASLPPTLGYVPPSLNAREQRIHQLWNEPSHNFAALRNEVTAWMTEATSLGTPLPKERLEQLHARAIACIEHCSVRKHCALSVTTELRQLIDEY